ncbi:MAG: hypothetical protein LBS10_08440 [Gracilibacteraceae bacterium]|jgi:hypothetical protein|nr:hypothetical protein [Gracilibacteraceae bacterium]
MRKRHRKQVLEILATLKEAQAEIERLLVDGDPAAPAVAAGIAADCRVAAEQVGDFIVRLAGPGTQTAALLAEYAGALGQAAGTVNAEAAAEWRRRLGGVESSARSELPGKLEVVFIPYKASMWDSLESVWLAARADPLCDAFVVPVPYFERLPDGSFGAACYEGGQYPGYVPVVDWRRYDFAERRPDMVFTHNPYDGDNYITSLHPDFYCERLRQFTDLLVYIPYFVCVDDVPEHFCTSAGVLRADRVFVQSEKIRRTYLRVFEEFERQNNWAGKFGPAGLKFVALGSPKFDKTIRTKSEDCPWPAEWRRLTEKADGSLRKIVLFNTTIDALLNGDEQVLAKLRYVFALFKNRADLLLWWRPHPLNAAAYRSMRPRLLAEYERIVADYRREAWGLYDDTPDLPRAVAVPDAYYGDWSSLVALYQCADKPVMIAAPALSDPSGPEAPLISENLYDDGENFWFTACDCNALFRLDKETWQAEYLGGVPGEKPLEHRLYRSITAWGGKLWLAPLAAEEIACYDPAGGSWEKIPLPAPPPGDYLSRVKFCAALAVGNAVYFVGCGYPAILRYEPASGALDCYADWVPRLCSPGADRQFGYFRKARLLGRTIAAASARTNAVLLFDPETCAATVYTVGGPENRYGDICFDGADYWLLPTLERAVVRWNPHTGLYREYADFPPGLGGGEWRFWDMQYADGALWLFPHHADMTVRLDTRDGVMSAVPEFAPQTGGMFWACRQSLLCGETLYAQMSRPEGLIAFHPGTGARRAGPITFSARERLHRDLAARNFDRGAEGVKTLADCYFYESAYVGLPHYADYIARGGGAPAGARAMFQAANANADGSSGAAIWAYCRDYLERAEGDAAAGGGG